eukprot:2767719-Rhodomonas_salina.2
MCRVIALTWRFFRVCFAFVQRWGVSIRVRRQASSHRRTRPVSMALRVSLCQYCRRQQYGVGTSVLTSSYGVRVSTDTGSMLLPVLTPEIAATL